VSKLRLLVVIPELSLGGAARIARDQAAAFATRYDVTEVVFNLDQGVHYECMGKLESLDIAGGGSIADKARHFAGRVRALGRLKRRLAVDLSVSHLEGAHYVDILSRGHEKIVLCVHGSILHNDEIRGAKGWLRKKVLIPALYRRADAIVTVSDSLAPELRQLGVPTEKIRTIKNFFDIDAIARSADEPIGQADRIIFEHNVPVLLVPARLHIHKNLAPLVDMVADLARRRPVRLVILGDGPQRDVLVARARANGPTYDVWSSDEPDLPCTFAFLGVKANPFPYFRRSALFLSSSLTEGFPLALCEAMACELAVVAADCPGGVRDILAPGSERAECGPRVAERTAHGMLMPMLGEAGEGREAWVDALDALLDDPAERKRLAKSGAQRVQDFTAAKVVPAWFCLFDELIGRPTERQARTGSRPRGTA
jgi:glycosyltransferase involved in cell wall biosynthesis